MRLTDAEKAHLARMLEDLTPREREVACEMAFGGLNEEVADRLCIALPTLRTHLMRINRKLGTGSKSDLVRFIAVNLIEGYRAGRIAPRAARIRKPGDFNGLEVETDPWAATAMVRKSSNSMMISSAGAPQ